MLKKEAYGITQIIFDFFGYTIGIAQFTFSIIGILALSNTTLSDSWFGFCSIVLVIRLFCPIIDLLCIPSCCLGHYLLNKNPDKLKKYTEKFENTYDQVVNLNIN